MDAISRLKEVLTDVKRRRGTLFASKESLVLDPEVEQIRQVAQKYVSSDDFRRVFAEVNHAISGV